MTSSTLWDIRALSDNVRSVALNRYFSQFPFPNRLLIITPLLRVQVTVRILVLSPCFVMFPIGLFSLSLFLFRCVRQSQLKWLFLFELYHRRVLDVDVFLFSSKTLRTALPTTSEMPSSSLTWVHVIFTVDLHTTLTDSYVCAKPNVSVNGLFGHVNADFPDSASWNPFTKAWFSSFEAHPRTCWHM